MTLKFTTSIAMPQPEMFIGMVIDRELTFHRCIGLTTYTKKNGDVIPMLLWESTSKKYGLVSQQMTTLRLQISRLRNLDPDKDLKRVMQGKVLAKRRKEEFSNS